MKMMMIKMSQEPPLHQDTRWLSTWGATLVPHQNMTVLCTDVDPQTSDIGVVPSEMVSDDDLGYKNIQNDLVVGLLGTPKDAQMLEDLRQDQATDRIPAAANPCCCTALEPTQRMDIYRGSSCDISCFTWFLNHDVLAKNRASILVVNYQPSLKPKIAQAIFNSSDPRRYPCLITSANYLDYPLPSSYSLKHKNNKEGSYFAGKMLEFGSIVVYSPLIIPKIPHSEQWISDDIR